jgi:sulfur carrier protein
MSVAVILNGEARHMEPGTTVAQIVAALDAGPRGVAVALNQEVVARSAWVRTEVCDGDRIDVLRAAQGG